MFSLFSWCRLQFKSSSSNKYGCTKSLFRSKSAFTLIELIVVITILAILALVAFLMMSDATVSARDSNRLASIKNIYDASQLQAVQQRLLPLPDQAITLTVSGTDIGWQGYMSGYVAQAYGYSDSVYDPRDNTPYIYRVNQTRNKSQYLAYLENGGEVTQGDLLLALGGMDGIERIGGVKESKSFAGLGGLEGFGIDIAQATDFSKRVPYVYGDRLGVVLSNTTNEGANVALGSGGTLDLGGNTIDSNYSVYVNEGLKLASVEGTGAVALKTNGGLDQVITGGSVVGGSGSGSGNPPPPTATYSLGRSSATVDEGSSVTFILTTTNVTDNTLVAYTLSGVDLGDLVGGSLSGDFSIVGNTAEVILTLASDATTEGSETIHLTLDNSLTSVDVLVNDVSIANNPNTMLLMHFDDTNGSTIFADSSTNNHIFTRSNTPTISTTQNKFGGSSLKNLNEGYLQSPTSSDWNLGNANFTIEAYVYLNAYTSYGPILSLRGPLSWDLLSQSIESSPVNKAEFTYWIGGTQYKIFSNDVVTLNTWHHIAIVRNGSSVRVYLDGIGGTPGNIGSSSIDNSSGNLTIGALGDGYTGWRANSYIDELRITKNQAIYTTDFTPPTAAFAN